MLQRVRHNPASDLAGLAVHTDPPREPGSAHAEPLAGLALVGKHWWSWEHDKISFKQYWKAEESLPRIPAPVLGVKDFVFPVCWISGPEVKGVAADKEQSLEWQKDKISGGHDLKPG